MAVEKLWGLEATVQNYFDTLFTFEWVAKRNSLNTNPYNWNIYNDGEFYSSMQIEWYLSFKQIEKRIKDFIKENE